MGVVSEEFRQEFGEKWFSESMDRMRFANAIQKSKEDDEVRYQEYLKENKRIQDLSIEFNDGKPWTPVKTRCLLHLLRSGVYGSSSITKHLIAEENIKISHLVYSDDGKLLGATSINYDDCEPRSIPVKHLKFHAGLDYLRYPKANTEEKEFRNPF